MMGAAVDEVSVDRTVRYLGSVWRFKVSIRIGLTFG